VDNSVENSESLELIKVNLRLSLERICQEHTPESIKYKYDNSPVTSLDLAISDYFEQIAKSDFPSFTFYSEEKFSEFKFPLMALDPLDGTREFIAGRPEWAVSLGLCVDDSFNGQGWIFNPMTGEEFSTASLRPFINKPNLCGEVSRSEWESGLFTETQNLVRPMGSIAYKLGRLCAGKNDFVVSLRPKNIWDIAAGTILCKKAGYKFYSQGKEVMKVEKHYLPPLLWCHESLYPELANVFKDA